MALMDMTEEEFKESSDWCGKLFDDLKYNSKLSVKQIVLLAHLFFVAAIVATKTDEEGMEKHLKALKLLLKATKEKADGTKES